MAREFGFKAELSFGRRGTFGQSYWAIYIQSTARDKRLQTKIIKCVEGWSDVPVTKHVKLGRRQIVTNLHSPQNLFCWTSNRRETLIWHNLPARSSDVQLGLHKYKSIFSSRLVFCCQGSNFFVNLNNFVKLYYFHRVWPLPREGRALVWFLHRVSRKEAAAPPSYASTTTICIIYNLPNPLHPLQMWRKPNVFCKQPMFTFPRNAPSPSTFLQNVYYYF